MLFERGGAETFIGCVLSEFVTRFLLEFHSLTVTGGSRSHCYAARVICENLSSFCFARTISVYISVPAPSSPITTVYSAARFVDLLPIISRTFCSLSISKCAYITRTNLHRLLR